MCRSVPKTGIVPFLGLVDHVMAMEPYRSAPRVFWIVDNGSSHQGQASVRRLRERYPNLILAHTPTHASSHPRLEAEYRLQPRPIRWKFTREEFDRRLQALESCTSRLAA